MGKFIRAMSALHEALDGEYDEKGRYTPTAEVKKIGMGHVVYHRCDQRVDALVAIGKVRLPDGTLQDGGTPMIQVVDLPGVIRYVESAIRGFQPNAQEVDKGHVARAAIALELLDPDVRAAYLKAKGPKAAAKLLAPPEDAGGEDDGDVTPADPDAAAAAPKPQAKRKGKK